MRKYIDAEKLIAEIKRRKNESRELAQEHKNSSLGNAAQTMANEDEEILSIIASLQQEQPDNEDIDKVAQELYEHLYELKRRNNVPTNLYEKQEIIDLWKAGIEYAYNHPKQGQPMPDSTKLIELWHEDKEMLKEKDFRDDPWRLAYNAFMCGFGRGIAVNKQEQPEVDLEKEIIRFLSNSAKMNKGEWRGKYAISEIGFRAVAHHFYEFGQRTKYQQDREKFAKLKAKEWQEGYNEGYAKGLNAEKERNKV